METHRNTWDIKANAIKDKSQEPEDIVKEHPDLVNEVAAIKIAEKFSQDKFSNAKDRDRFVTEVRHNLSINLEKGQQSIDVKLNEQQVVEQEKEEESHEL
jgi:putative DNA primase/helicase